MESMTYLDTWGVIREARFPNYFPEQIAQTCDRYPLMYCSVIGLHTEVFTR